MYTKLLKRWPNVTISVLDDVFIVFDEGLLGKQC